MLLYELLLLQVATSNMLPECYSETELPINCSRLAAKPVILGAAWGLL